MLIEAGLLIARGRQGAVRPLPRPADVPDPRSRAAARSPSAGASSAQASPNISTRPIPRSSTRAARSSTSTAPAPPARKSERLIVVEGYMDVIALAQAGIDEAVAPARHRADRAQLERLWRLVDVPILASTATAPGRKRRSAPPRALPQLGPGRTLAFVTLPAGPGPRRPGPRRRPRRVRGAARRRPSRSSTGSGATKSTPSRSTRPKQRAGLKRRLHDIAEASPTDVRAAISAPSSRPLLRPCSHRSARRALRAARRAAAQGRPFGPPPPPVSRRRAGLRRERHRPRRGPGGARRLDPPSRRDRAPYRGARPAAARRSGALALLDALSMLHLTDQTLDSGRLRTILARPVSTRSRVTCASRTHALFVHAAMADPDAYAPTWTRRSRSLVAPP